MKEYQEIKLLLEELKLLYSTQESNKMTEDASLDQTRIGRLSRMDALQQQAMLKAIDARNVSKYYSACKALMKLDAGDYGICENCGENISEGRMQIDPIAIYCLDCAINLEIKK